MLTDEERKQKFQGKVKRKQQPKDNVIENTNNNLSEEELFEVKELVNASGHFEMRKVNDMETSLLRNIVKYVSQIKDSFKKT